MIISRNKEFEQELKKLCEEHGFSGVACVAVGENSYAEIGSLQEETPGHIYALYTRLHVLIRNLEDAYFPRKETPKNPRNGPEGALN